MPRWEPEISFLAETCLIAPARISLSILYSDAACSLAHGSYFDEKAILVAGAPRVDGTLAGPFFTQLET